MIDFLVKLNCPHCGENFDVDCKEYIVGSTSGDKDNGMGKNIQWMIECKSKVCPICQKGFSFKGTIGEYPEGAVEFVDVKALPVFDGDEDENDKN